MGRRRHYRLFVKRERENAKLPRYVGKNGNDAINLYACLDCASVCVPPGEERLIPLGISVAVEPGFELKMRSLHGLRLKYKVVVCERAIGCEYREELKVLIENRRKVFGYVVKDGACVAEGVIQRIHRHEIVDVGEGELPEAPLS